MTVARANKTIMETSRHASRQLDHRRGAGPRVRPAALSRVVTSRRTWSHRRHPRRLPRPYPPSRLDERHDQATRPHQALDKHIGAHPGCNGPEDVSKRRLVVTITWQNMFAARAFRSDHELAKVGQPPAAEQWEMNAHCLPPPESPSRFLPAAILQSPFYAPRPTMRPASAVSVQSSAMSLPTFRRSRR